MLKMVGAGVLGITTSTGIASAKTDVGSADNNHRRFFDDFEWGGPLGEKWRHNSPQGVEHEITPDAAFSGDFGVRGMLDASAHSLSEPGQGLDYYPRKGDEIVSVINVTDFREGEDWVVSPLYIPLDRWYDRWSIYLDHRGGFHISVTDIEKDDRWLGASARSVFDWNKHVNRWFAVATKWYWNEPQADGRSGVRSAVFYADEFPFGRWSFDDFDSDAFGDLYALADIDTGDDSNAVLDDRFEAETDHFIGFWDQTSVKAHVDDIELVSRLGDFNAD